MTPSIVSSESSAWYVYAILPVAATAPDVEAILPDLTVETLAIGACTVLVSLVPRADFDQSNLKHRMADPDWVAARIAAHHAVNVAATASGPCLPLGFGTLFSTLEKLREWIEMKRGALVTALDEVAKLQEWSLVLQKDSALYHGWLDRHDTDLQALAKAAAGAGEGTAFLISRRHEKARCRASETHLTVVKTDIVGQLLGHGLLVRVEQRRASSAATPTSWTVFAPVASHQMLIDVVRNLSLNLAPSGLTLLLTGPWPAYAFARATLAEEAAHA